MLIYAPYCSLINLLFYFSELYFVLLFPANMTNLKLYKQKKLMGAARARCGEQSASKRDLLSIQTRTLKRKKVDIVKASHVVSKT